MATVGFVVVLLVGFIVICLRVVPVLQEGVVDNTFSALALSYSCTAALNLSYAASTLATCSMLFSSVERIKQYVDFVPTEDEVEYDDENNEPTTTTTTSIEMSEKEKEEGGEENENIKKKKQEKKEKRKIAGKKVPPLPSSWPEDGSISFENVNMRYRPNLPLVLKNVSFSVPSGSTIGVCGKTGSGKSSLFVAFFRLVNPESGSIRLSGRDICDVKLAELRSKVTIISQNPLLFAGTIKSNLDPFKQFSRAQLEKVLSDVGMLERLKRGGAANNSNNNNNNNNNNKEKEKEKEKETKQKEEDDDNDNFDDPLEAVVEEKGSNFSMGERSLLCLARGALKGTRILLIDEATASVDMQTDLKIQRVIEDEFKGATKLIIAHRLASLCSGCDKILTLSKGRVLEFSSPLELLHDEKSSFYSLVKKQGRLPAMIQLAQEYENRKQKEISSKTTTTTTTTAVSSSSSSSSSS